MATIYNEQRTVGVVQVDTAGSPVVDASTVPASARWGYAALAGGIVSSTTDVSIKAAAGAGVRNYLSSLQIDHDALGGATEFVIKDGSTVIFRGKLQTAAIERPGSLNFDPPLRGSVNTALNFALLTAVTGGVYVNAQGFVGS